MIGFIYKLGIGSQSVNNLEEQISMIAHILTAGNLSVIVILIHRIGAQVLERRTEGHVIIAIIPIVLSFDASISIIEWHIGWLCPDIAIGAIVVVAYFLALAIDAIDSHGGCKPLGYIV